MERVIKNEMQPKVNIEWLGSIGGQDPDSQIWLGDISTVETGDFGIHEKTAKESFVAVDDEAYVRCIDGRCAECLAEKLGPQGAGGSVIHALAMSVAEARQLIPGKTLAGEVNELKSRYEQYGFPFKPGNHVSDHAHDEFIGCGAVDKMPKILEILANPDALDEIIRLTKGIMGNDFFDKDVFDKSGIRLGAINQESFIPEDEFRKKTSEVIGEDSNEKLQGEHHEVLLIVNKCKNETFDRDGFIEKSGAQAFNYDYWYTMELAKELFPDDSGAQKIFIMTNVMYNVATAMALTDGSLQLGIRQ
jgi:hypothetical protein